MKERKHLTAGQLAKICGVEKHILFHYDEIRLFQPAIVNGNGYRYYSYHQYDTFSVIAKLRKMGMPLKGIKVFLEQRSPAVFLQLLKGKFEGMDREIEKLPALKRMTVYMKGSTLFAVAHEDENITIRQYPREILLYNDDLENASSRSFASFMGEYISFCKEYNVLIQESVSCMIKTSNIRNRDYLNFSRLFVKIERNVHRNTHIREEGSYLCAWYKGSHGTIQNTYERMLAYAKQCDLVIGPYTYEEYLIADIAQKDHARCVTYIRMDLVDQKQRGLLKHYFIPYPYLHGYALMPGIYRAPYRLRYNPANRPLGLLARAGVLVHVTLFYMVGTSPGEWLMHFSTSFPYSYCLSTQLSNATE